MAVCRHSEQDLDGAKVTGCPVDDRCLRSPERMRPVLASHQADPRNPFIDEPSILAGAEVPAVIDPAWEDVVVDRAAPPIKPS